MKTQDRIRGGIWAAKLSLCMLAAGSALAAGPRFEFEMAAALSGPCCGDSGHDISIDPDGSFFIVGNYGALDLDGDGVIDQRSEGGQDPIVIKGRASGSLAWVRAPRSPAMTFARLSVASDRRGGAYVAGGFRDNLLLRSGTRIVSAGETDGMLIRYGADGTPLWARAIGGAGNDWLVDAATDSNGNLYAAGVVRGNVDLDSDGDPDATVAGTGQGLLLASWNPQGGLRWARVAASAQEVMAGALDVSSRGEVSVAAHYLGADVDLDGDARPDLPAAGRDGATLLARFDSAGRLLSAAAVRQPGNGRIDALAIAGNGDLLVGGWSQGSVDLDRDGGPDVRVRPGKRTSYVARLGENGQLRWLRTVEADQRATVTAIATRAGRIAISGLYRGAIDFDGDGRVDGAADPDGKSEGFVAILDDSGAMERFFAINGPGADQARGVDFSRDGRSLLMTGFVRLTADFDGDGQPEGAVRCDARGDIVWARYGLRAEATRPIGQLR